MEDSITGEFVPESHRVWLKTGENDFLFNVDTLYRSYVESEKKEMINPFNRQSLPEHVIEIVREYEKKMSANIYITVESNIFEVMKVTCPYYKTYGDIILMLFDRFNVNITAMELLTTDLIVKKTNTSLFLMNMNACVGNNTLDINLTGFKDRSDRCACLSSLKKYLESQLNTGAESVLNYNTLMEENQLHMTSTAVVRVYYPSSGFVFPARIGVSYAKIVEKIICRNVEKLSKMNMCLSLFFVPMMATNNKAYAKFSNEEMLLLKIEDDIHIKIRAPEDASELIAWLKLSKNIVSNLHLKKLILLILNEAEKLDLKMEYDDYIEKLLLNIGYPIMIEVEVEHRGMSFIFEFPAGSTYEYILEKLYSKLSKQECEDKFAYILCYRGELGDVKDLTTACKSTKLATRIARDKDDLDQWLSLLNKTSLYAWGEEINSFMMKLGLCTSDLVLSVSVKLDSTERHFIVGRTEDLAASIISKMVRHNIFNLRLRLVEDSTLSDVREVKHNKKVKHISIIGKGEHSGTELLQWLEFIKFNDNLICSVREKASKLVRGLYTEAATVILFEGSEISLGDSMSPGCHIRLIRQMSAITKTQEFLLFVCMLSNQIDENLETRILDCTFGEKDVFLSNIRNNPSLVVKLFGTDIFQKLEDMADMICLGYNWDFRSIAYAIAVRGDR